MGLSDLVLKKKSPDILNTLNNNPTHVRGIREEIGGSASTIQTRIREMKEEGLIKEEQQNSFPFKKILKLTEMGKDMVDILKNFEGVEKKRKIETVAFGSEKEKLKWPLIMLFQCGKLGGTKIQKLTFLGKYEFEISLPYNFSPYKHGPFSKELARDMGKLMTLGLVDPLEDQYKLTSEGRNLVKGIFKDLDTSEREAIKNLEKFSRMDLRGLLNLVYEKYPDESGNPNA